MHSFFETEKKIWKKLPVFKMLINLMWYMYCEESRKRWCVVLFLLWKSGQRSSTSQRHGREPEHWHGHVTKVCAKTVWSVASSDRRMKFITLKNWHRTILMMHLCHWTWTTWFHCARTVTVSDTQRTHADTTYYRTEMLWCADSNTAP